MTVGSSTMATCGDVGGKFGDKASNRISQYATPCWPVTDCKMNYLE